MGVGEVQQRDIAVGRRVIEFGRSLGGARSGTQRCACRSGKGFRPAVDQRASPSYNPDVAAATVECCERELYGTWHLAGADVLDRMAYALLICRAFDLDASTLTPATTAQLGQKAARPLNGGLRIGKAQAQLRTPLRGVEAGLRAMRAALEAVPDGA